MVLLALNFFSNSLTHRKENPCCSHDAFVILPLSYTEHVLKTIHCKYANEPSSQLPDNTQ